EQQEKLPLDAKLLADTVIELNISRRSVGFYPPEHPIIRDSIERAYQHLQKLFEIRHVITLGIAKDTLVVDEYILDRGNPVFREFAGVLHAKGIAAITFTAGLKQPELVKLHEVISSREGPMGKELAERAGKEITHITLSPIDFNNFFFVEGAQRNDKARGDIWEDYIYGLLEGKLFDGDGPGILSIPEEVVANAVNAMASEDTSDESYDRVITAYVRKKGESRMSSEAFAKFFSFVERLRPEIKKQFLARSGMRLSEDIGEVEAIISEMTSESFQKIADLLTEHESHIPTTLKNLIDRLTSIKQVKSSYFDFRSDKSAVLDDIELGDDVVKLFSEDNFHAYVNREYQKELEFMLETRTKGSFNAYLFGKQCEEDAIDHAAFEIMLELLSVDLVTLDDYRTIIARLSDFVDVFIETGRFGEVLDMYNTLNAQVADGRFRDEAADVVEHFFHSPELIPKLIDAFKVWGRKERDGAIRLAVALRQVTATPLLDALIEEQDSSIRKFLISVLEAIGSDVVPFAVKKLNDSRWYVLRNMISLIRACDGKKEVDKVRAFIKHQNVEVSMEALRTLLHFRTADAGLHLRSSLQSESDDIRKGAIRLAGNFRVRDAVPYLIKFVEKRDLFGNESFLKKDALKALGDIGDSRAVEALLKIYQAKSLIYQSALEDLKVEIFRNLNNYPFGSVKKLIDLGLSSKNAEIRTLSEKSLMTFLSAEEKKV
ncbi:MAG TPA: HEAT repeat domain-containing protein, partial [Thermodesulfovibrionales bacterium]|nr:HEAT repeat domain-containing protein [Thermodesulfovibrionales bacterium]